MMILHLHVKEKWYRMTESGEKPEEYRAIKPYWIKRLCFARRNEGHCEMSKRVFCLACFCGRDPFLFDNFTHVCLHLGYTKESLTQEIAAIDIGYGNPAWGAPPTKQVIIIKYKIGGES